MLHMLFWLWLVLPASSVMCPPCPEALSLLLREAMESAAGQTSCGVKAGAAHSGPVPLDHVISMEEGPWVVAHLGHNREEGLKEDRHCLRALGYPGTAGHGLQHLVKWHQPRDTMGLLRASPEFCLQVVMVRSLLGITCFMGLEEARRCQGLPGQQSQGQASKG